MPPSFLGGIGRVEKRPRTWPEFVEFYRSCGPAYEPIRSLIDYISISRHASSVHPRLLMGCTLLYRSPTYDTRDGVLWIQSFPPRNVLQFLYTTSEHISDAPCWSCLPDDGIQAFERFVTDHQW